MLLCERPHERTIDFASSQFVVGKTRGININGQHLEYGDEVPQGVLDPRTLRQLYEPPVRSIELMDYALKDESLLQAMVERSKLSGIETDSSTEGDKLVARSTVETSQDIPKRKTSKKKYIAR